MRAGDFGRSWKAHRCGFSSSNRAGWSAPQVILCHPVRHRPPAGRSGGFGGGRSWLACGSDRLALAQQMAGAPSRTITQLTTAAHSPFRLDDDAFDLR
jgi:hypothetical protein